MTNSALKPQALMRSKSFWLATVFVLYSVFGWLIAPLIISDQLQSQLKQLANWDVRVEQVRLNPYRLALEVEGLNAQDGNGHTVVSWQRLYANYNLLALLRGVIALDEISLETPYVRLSFDASGTTNFQKDFSRNSTDEPPQPETESDPLKLYFGKIRLSDGHIDLEDSSQGEVINFQLEPVALELDNFGTTTEEGGEYALRLSLGEGQIVDWQGQLGIAPFYSSGKLSLQNIRSDSFWPYLKAYSPLLLQEARVSIDAEYDTRGADGTTLQIEQGSVRIDNLRARLDAGSEEDVLQLEQLTLGPVRLSLEEQRVQLGNLILAAPSVILERRADGTLDIASAFASASTTSTGGENDSDAAPAAAPAPASPAWQWQLDRLVMNQGRATWRDNTLAAPAELQVSSIDLALQDINQDLSRLSPYALHLKIGESRHQFGGLLSAQPFVLEGQFDIAALPLAISQHYLSDLANVQLDSGTLNLSGDYALRQQDTLTGTVTMVLTLNEIATSDTAMRKSLAGFKRLHIQPINVQLHPFAISVGEATLDAPYGDIIIDAQGKLNLAQLARSSKAATSASQPPAPGTETETETETVSVSLQRFAITGGRVNFYDASISPPFNTYLGDIEGSLTGLDSATRKASQLVLKGKVDQFGALDTQGSLNLFDPAQPSEFDIAVQNINLSSLSPYGARYLGYPIDKGKLDLDLDYAIAQSKLDARNHVVIDNLELGKRSNSDKALKLPLPLALAILENTQGVIDIKLPVSGDLNDPGFSVGNVLFTAFTNLLTKAIASPFTILGSLIGGGADLSEVYFAPGTASLDSAENQRLRLLAEALQKRPNLNLEIRGQADRSSDLDALKSQRLEEALASVSDADALQARKRLADEWELDQPYTELARQYENERGSAQHVRAIDTLLRAQIEIDDLSFVQLAKQRAQAVLKNLQEQHGIAAERLYVLEAQIIDTQTNAKKVAVPFSLGVR